MRETRRAFLKAVGTGAATLPVLVCDSSPAAEPAVESPRPQTPSPVCKSVLDLGPQFLDNRLRITGQDGATSTRLPSGDGFWLFGDTIEGPFDDIREHDLTDVLSSTACIVPTQDVSQGITKFEFLKSSNGKRPRQIIAFNTDENKAKHRLWPIHGVCVDNVIYAFYHKITMDPEECVFETFELNGMGIARARIGEYRFKRLTAPDGSHEFWKGDQPSFGVFIEKLPDGYLYLWGSYWTGMFLARTRPETIEDITSYEYLVEAPTLADPETTPVWKKKFEPNAVLFEGVPNELSVSFNPFLKRHIAIHCFHRDNKLVVRTSPSITGPWSEPEIFYQPNKKSTDDLFYAGKEHPELRREDGKIIYVTYINSSTYVPHLLEVTLA